MNVKIRRNREGIEGEGDGRVRYKMAGGRKERERKTGRRKEMEHGGKEMRKRGEVGGGRMDEKSANMSRKGREDGEEDGERAVEMKGSVKLKGEVKGGGNGERGRENICWEKRWRGRGKWKEREFRELRGRGDIRKEGDLLSRRKKEEEEGDEEGGTSANEWN